MCSLAVMSLREDRGARKEEKQNAVKENMGYFSPLRDRFSEIISSSQLPIMCQPKALPSFVSHQPIHRALLLHRRTAACLGKSQHLVKISWSLCNQWPVRRNAAVLGPWSLPGAGGPRAETTHREHRVFKTLFERCSKTQRAARWTRNPPLFSV